jgi:cellulose biosynthesis protein BcsQ
MAHVLAVSNMKGGVGKSSIVVSLADTFAARGKGPVLVIDIDTQASSSYCLSGDECLTWLISNNKTIDQFLERRIVNGEVLPLEHFVRRQVSNTTGSGKGALEIALIASSTNLRLSERQVLHQLTQQGTQQGLSLTGIEERLTETLATELESFGNEFTYIIFDCAPGISPLTTAAISCANLVVVPTIPDFISVLGLDAFLHSVRRDMTHQAAHRPPHVLITRSQARTRHGWASLWSGAEGRRVRTNTHQEFEEKIRGLAKTFPEEMGVFKTVLDETPAIPVAMAMGASHKYSPTYQQKYPSPLNRVLEKLTKEIEEVLT